VFIPVGSLWRSTCHLLLLLSLRSRPCFLLIFVLLFARFLVCKSPRMKSSLPCAVLSDSGSRFHVSTTLTANELFSNILCCKALCGGRLSCPCAVVFSSFLIFKPLFRYTFSYNLRHNPLQFNKKYGIIPVTTNTVSPFDFCSNDKWRHLGYFPPRLISSSFVLLKIKEYILTYQLCFFFFRGGARGGGGKEKLHGSFWNRRFVRYWGKAALVLLSFLTC
jgi:hypothetical protein